MSDPPIDQPPPERYLFEAEACSMFNRQLK